MQMTLSIPSGKVNRIRCQHQKKIFKLLVSKPKEDTDLNLIAKWLCKTCSMAFSARIEILFHLRALISYLTYRALIAQTLGEITKNNLLVL